MLISPRDALISATPASSHGRHSDDETDVNMAADCRVESLYDLAAFTTVKNCDVFKSEFRSLPNAVQCDIYRTVSLSWFSLSFCS